MEIRSLEEFKNGWVCGNFEPSLFKTYACELMIREFEAGHKGDSHFHKQATEYNILVRGEAFLGEDRNVRIYDGVIWILKPGEKCEIEYKVNSIVVTIKAPSVPGDKYYSMPKPPASKELENDASLSRKFNCNDLYISPEALKECKDWMPSAKDVEEYHTTFGGSVIPTHKKSLTQE